MKTVSLRFSDELHKKLKDLADFEKRSFQNQVLWYCEQMLQEYEKKTLEKERRTAAG